MTENQTKPRFSAHCAFALTADKVATLVQCYSYDTSYDSSDYTSDGSGYSSDSSGYIC